MCGIYELLFEKTYQPIYGPSLKKTNLWTENVYPNTKNKERKVKGEPHHLNKAEKHK
jgi:hypothetical protein